MPANTDPIFVLIPNIALATFVNADGTTKKTIFTPGTDGSLLRALGAVSDDTAVMNLDLYLTISGTDYPIGTVQIAAGAGRTANTNAINLLDTTKIKALLSPDGSLFLPSTALLKGAMQVAVTAAKAVTVIGQGGNY